MRYFATRLKLTDPAPMLKKHPSFFNLSIEDNLEPTIVFWEVKMGPVEARAFIVGFPACLTRSLEKRLKPRFARFKASSDRSGSIPAIKSVSPPFPADLREVWKGGHHRTLKVSGE